MRVRVQCAMGLELLARFLRPLRRDAAPDAAVWRSAAALRSSGPRSQWVRVSAIALNVSAAVGNFRRSPARGACRATARGATRALESIAHRRRFSVAAGCAAWSPLFCSGGSHSQRGAHRGRRQCALSAGGHRRGVASFGAGAVASLSRHRCTRRRSCAPRVRGAAESNAAVWRSIAAPLPQRLALSAQCASWSTASRTLFVRLSAGSSRPSGWSPSRCSCGFRCTRRRSCTPRARRSAASVRRRGARPPLLCSGNSRPQRFARCGRGRRTLSSRGCQRGRHVLRVVPVALHLWRRCTWRRSCAPRARRSAASDAAVWRSIAAPLQ